MRVCGQHFGGELIRRIQATVNAEREISRRELSRQVCQLLEWRGPSGKLKAMSCRKALVELDRRGVLSLPAGTTGFAFQRPSGVAEAGPDRVGVELCPLPIEGSLADLGDVEVVPVTSRSSRASHVWTGLMREFHYLGAGPLCGAQLRYVVKSSRCGWLGGLSFSAAAWRLKARDEWIGWSDGARRAHLPEVVCNSRFLIVPTVRVANLASQVLSRSLARLPGDWQERYGYAPLLVETFVDGERFAATSYRAANWIHLGQTAGRAAPYGNGKHSTGPKEIYVHPLRRNCRELLCREPEIRLGACPRPDAPADWAEEEFGAVRLYDERLKARLYRVARDFFAHPGALVPEACGGSEAKTKAAYRLFDNRQVDMSTLLRGHLEATVARIGAQRVVLAVQDTTTLNYTAHPATEGLGPISTTENSSVGMILHDTLAFTVDGTPLGLLNVQCWARGPTEAGKKHKRHQLPIEEKESVKWLKSYEAVSEVKRLCPETIVVSVGDREADLYELFALAATQPLGPKLLVRAERTRQRRVEEERLWEKLQRKPLGGHQELFIPRKGSRPARTARLAIRYAEVKLHPPASGRHVAPITMWAVYAQEVEAGPGVTSPLEWMLLTTVPVASFEDACERLAWYARRWGIEVYHRTLKSGCRIEDRRLAAADRLEACLAVDMVVAWRIFLLTKQGRETPDIPCDVYLKEEEWQALCAYVNKARHPEQPPSLREAMRMMAKLGGFLGRKGDGDPGTNTIWRGLQRLADITLGFTLGKVLYQTSAGP